MMQRTRFDISGSSSPFTDTGPPIHGALMQMRWYPTTPDTGADLGVDLVMDTADTGQNMIIYDDNDCLGVPFTRVPCQAMHHSDGFDTGAAVESLFVAAGERLRIRITPGGASVAGRLHVWTQS